MTKKALNQNAKYVQELINTIEPNFNFENKPINRFTIKAVSYTHLRAHETCADLVCRLLLEKKKKKI